jgi:hypothetical protein
MSWNKISFNESGQPLLFDGEKPFFNAENVSLEYENGGGYPGEGQCFQCSSGTAILTSIRFIYIPTRKTAILSSFSAPLQNVLDGKSVSNWLKGETYSATVKSVPNEGFSKEYGQLKLEFPKKGTEFKGAFDHLRARLGVMPEQYYEALPKYENQEPSSSSPHELPPDYS